MTSPMYEYPSTPGYPPGYAPSGYSGLPQYGAYQQPPGQQHPGQPQPGQQHPGQQHSGQQYTGQQHRVQGVQQHPVQQHPVQQHPVQQHPVQQHPGQQHHVQQHSGQQHPHQQYLSLQHPAQQHPAQQHPSQQHLGQQRSVQQHPSQQHPSQQHLGQQRSVQQHPSQQQLAQQHPSQQIPGQQRSVQQHPSQQHPSQHHLPQQHSAQRYASQQHALDAQPPARHYLPQQYPAPPHPAQQLSRQHPAQHPSQPPSQPHSALQYSAQIHPSLQHPAQLHSAQQHASQQHSRQYPTHLPLTQPPSRPHSVQPHTALQVHPTQPAQQPSRQHPGLPHPTKPHLVQLHPTQHQPAQLHPAQLYPSAQHLSQQPSRQHPVQLHYTRPPPRPHSVQPASSYLARPQVALTPPSALPTALSTAPGPPGHHPSCSCTTCAGLGSSFASAFATSLGVNLGASPEPSYARASPLPGRGPASPETAVPAKRIRNERVESPVDLSVRTVRRSADSTAWHGQGDSEDCDSTASPRASPRASPCAPARGPLRAPRLSAVVPRMNFMPDFSAARFHQQQQQEQQHEEEQQQHQEQQQVSLPGMSTLPWARTAARPSQHSPLLPLFSSNRSSLYPSSSAPALPPHAADPTGYLGYLHSPADALQDPRQDPLQDHRQDPFRDAASAGGGAGGARIRTKAEMKMWGGDAAAEAVRSWVTSSVPEAEVEKNRSLSCEASTSGLSSSDDRLHLDPKADSTPSQGSAQELRCISVVMKAKATALVSAPASLSALDEGSSIPTLSPSPADIEPMIIKSTSCVQTTSDADVIPSSEIPGLPLCVQVGEHSESAWEQSCLDFEQQLEASESNGALKRRPHRKSNERTSKICDNTSIEDKKDVDKTLMDIADKKSLKPSRGKQNTSALSPCEDPLIPSGTKIKPAVTPSPTRRKPRSNLVVTSEDSDSSSGSDEGSLLSERVSLGLRSSLKNKSQKVIRTRSAKHKGIPAHELLLPSKKCKGSKKDESGVSTRNRSNGLQRNSAKSENNSLEKEKTANRPHKLKKIEQSPTKVLDKKGNVKEPMESDEADEPNITETRSVKIRLRTRVVEIEQAYSLRPKGDGSDFRPGWEEEVLQYKRSLRMPQVLINMSKGTVNSEGECSKSSICSMSESAAELQSSKVTSRQNSEVDSASIYCDVESEDASSSIPFSINSRKGTPKLSIVDQLVEKVSQVSAIKKINSSLKNKETSNSKVSKSSRNADGLQAKRPVTNFRDAFLQLQDDKKNTNESLKAVFGTANVQPIERGQKMPERSTVKSKPSSSKKKSESFPPRKISLRKRSVIIPKSTSRRNSSLGDVKPSEGIVLRPREAKPLSGPRPGQRSAALVRRSKVVLNSKHKKDKKLVSQHLAKDSANEGVEGQCGQTEVKCGGDNVELSSVEVSNLQPVVVRKRMKLRRKFRSGFDYIRKKKKVKKNDVQKIVVQKAAPVVERIPMSEEQIQVAIRNWVVNRSHGDTVLHRAARLGYAEVAEYAIEKLKISPRVADNAGYTPLHEAARRGHLEISKILLERGADVSCSAQGGVRPLHEAAESNQVEILRLLLEYGADPTVATYSNQTPLSIVEPDSEAHHLLTLHLADVQGLSAPPWRYRGPSKIFDMVTYQGDCALQSPPSAESDIDVDINVISSEVIPPPLHSFYGEPSSQLWVLFQDLMKVLNVSSEEELLSRLSDSSSDEPLMSQRGSTQTRDLSVEEFLHRTKAVTFLAPLNHLPVPGSLVKLVEYSSKVQELLNEEVTTLNP